MMNKYITALLVVLATTGVEAQTYQSALKAAMDNATLEEFCKGHDLDVEALKKKLEEIGFEYNAELKQFK